MTAPATIRAALSLFFASISMITLAGQRGGGPPQSSNLPASPVAAPIPAISTEITGPGRMFESLMELAPGDDMAHFGYEAREYFVSGTANAQPYKTRIVVRTPADAGRPSGLVLAEPRSHSGSTSSRGKGGRCLCTEM